MAPSDRELLTDPDATAAMIRERPLAAVAYALVSIAKDIRAIAGDVRDIRREQSRRR